MNVNKDNRFSFHDTKEDGSSVAIIEFVDEMNCITALKEKILKNTNVKNQILYWKMNNNFE